MLLKRPYVVGFLDKPHTMTSLEMLLASVNQHTLQIDRPRPRLAPPRTDARKACSTIESPVNRAGFASRGGVYLGRTSLIALHKVSPIHS